MPLRRWGKPVQFPVQSKGEWLAILRLKVVSTTPLKAEMPSPPSGGVPDRRGSGRRVVSVKYETTLFSGGDGAPVSI
jgi:hypothetical protein